MGEVKQKILLVDDDWFNRELMEELLKDQYDILHADNGKQALAILQQSRNEIDVMLLDMVMPEMDGLQVLEFMNKYNWVDDVPVIMITSDGKNDQLVEKAYELGVTDFIDKGEGAVKLSRRINNTIMLYAKQRKLVGLVTEQIYEKEKSNSLMVNILSHIVEFRNGESGLHVLHINIITEMILRHLQTKTDKYPKTTSEITMIATASALHDIGKIGIPDAILNKPGRFTPEEFEIMKEHSALGASMLEKIPFHQEEPLVKVAKAICRWHHERFDGRGYPDGLKGDEIPIEAQVVALADVYDALTSERVYKKAIPHEKAKQMILDGECGAFNPLLLECLQEIGDEIIEELKVNSVGRNTQKQMANVTSELLRHKELTVSEKTLRMLEHERTKYRFFASMSKEIQFEYTVAPPMVTISDWGVEQLGLEEVTMDPRHNENVLRLMGEENLQKITELLHKATPDNPVVQYDCRIHLKNQERWNRMTCRAMWSGNNKEYVSVIGKMTDVQEEKDHLSNLEYLASHDGLTGLMNHMSAKKLIQEKIEESEGGEFAMVIFDLDYFKLANDNFGHAFGDRVLQHVAKRLKQSIRSGDVAARVGGDEILIFLTYKTGIESIVNRIFHSLIEDFEGFQISISMGVAKTETVGRDYATLFHHADQALYTAKREGRGQFRFYDASMSETFSAISPIEG